MSQFSFFAFDAMGVGIRSMEGSLLQCVGPDSERGHTYATFFPKQFFVSWCGVLTLVYTGFPQTLLNLKADLGRACSCIAPENPGSKWPKTGLAAVNDDAPSITKEQFLELQHICQVATSLLQAAAADQMPIRFDSLSYVHYQNRCASMAPGSVTAWSR